MNASCERYLTCVRVYDASFSWADTLGY